MLSSQVSLLLAISHVARVFSLLCPFAVGTGHEMFMLQLIHAKINEVCNEARFDGLRRIHR